MTPPIESRSILQNKSLLQTGSLQHVVVEQAYIVPTQGNQTKIGDVRCAGNKANPLVNGHICIDDKGNKQGHVIFKNGEEVKFNPKQSKSTVKDETYEVTFIPEIVMSTSWFDDSKNTMYITSMTGFNANVPNGSDSYIKLNFCQSGIVDVSDGNTENEVTNIVRPRHYDHETGVYVKLGNNDTLYNATRKGTFMQDSPGIYKVYETKPVKPQKQSSIFVNDMFKK